MNILVQDAREGIHNSKYRDWYVWSKKKPPRADRGMVFPGVQKSTWTYDDSEAKAWYFHRFYDFQPDLNTSQPGSAGRNPQDHGLLDSARRFRLPDGCGAIRDRDQGAEGQQANGAVRHAPIFPRIPAVAAGRLHHSRGSQRPARDRHGIFRQGWRPHAHDVQLSGQPESILRARLGRYAAAGRSAEGDQKPRPRRRSGACSCATTTNSISVGSRSSSGRRCSRRSGPSRTCSSTTAAFDVGLHRCSTATERRLELAYSLLFTLPGTPVIRYGDEIGMGDDLSLPERNCARTPMQWSNEPHGGFTKSDKPLLPVICGGPYGFEHINAAIQRRHPELAAELDRTHHPHAQGGAGNWLGRFCHYSEPRSRGSGHAI